MHEKLINIRFAGKIHDSDGVADVSFLKMNTNLPKPLFQVTFPNEHVNAQECSNCEQNMFEHV